MKKLLLLLLVIPVFANGQDVWRQDLKVVDSLIMNEMVEEGYLKLKELKPQIPLTDSMYMHVLYSNLYACDYLESQSRMSEDFEKSLGYAHEIMELLKIAKELFGIETTAYEFYAARSLMVSNFGLGRYDVAREYRDVLYDGYRNNILPKGIDEYFNFDYFKWEDKNIWGYEWYCDLPEDRFSSSFSKIVYYVYSTDTDGNDKDQLYRLHVLMYHGEGMDFDYVMTKQQDTPEAFISGTIYAFKYKEDIDYEKLRNDVMTILRDNIQPDTKRVVPKVQRGPIQVDIEL